VSAYPSGLRPDHDLVRTRWSEISFVPKGANGKTFLIFKGFDEMGLEEDILSAILGTPLDKETQIDGIFKEHKVEGDAATVLKGAIRLIKAYEDVLPKDVATVIAKCSDYPAPAAGQGEDAKKECPKGENCYGYPIKKSVDGEYDLSDVPPEMQPIIKELWTEREARQIEKEERQKLQDAAITKELEEEITKELSMLPVETKPFAQVLKQFRELDPDGYKAIMPVLKAASKGLAKSELFKTHGRTGAGSMTGSAWDRLVGIAKGMVAKGAEDMTLEEAINKAMDEHPELVEQYEAEHAAQVRAVGMV